MGAEKILVIEDDAVVLTGLTANLLREGYRVFSAASGSEAMQRVGTDLPDLVIVDLEMPREDACDPWGDGLTILQWLRRSHPEGDLPALIYSAHLSPAITARAKACGVSGVFEKGCDLKALFRAIREVLSAKASV